MGYGGGMKQVSWWAKQPGINLAIDLPNIDKTLKRKTIASCPILDSELQDQM